MKKSLTKMISVIVMLAMLFSVTVIPASALTWEKVSETHYASRYFTSDYATGKFYKNLKQVPLTGDGRRDVVAVAASQVGYIEGSSSAGYDGETGGSLNFTEYGYYMGLTGGSGHAWCAAFCSWCFYAAEITDVDGYYSDTGSGNIWADTYVPDWSNYLISQGCYKAAYQFRNSYPSLYDASYVPQPGDLVFFYTASGDYPGWEGHIGLVAYSDGTYVYTLEGNTSSQQNVESEGGGMFFKKYSLTGSSLVGFGSMPHSSVSGLPTIDYSGKNPTAGLYVSVAGSKSVYKNINDTTASWTLPMSSMFEVLEVSKNSSGQTMLYSKCEINGSTVYGWILHGNDSNGYSKTLQIYAEPNADSGSGTGSGTSVTIPDSYGATINSKGDYVFENAYGYEFSINDVNGKIDGEDATLITNSSAYNSCNPNWAVSVQLRPTGNTNEYQVVKVVNSPGSASAAKISLSTGDVILVVHSSASKPGTYANWMSKVAAIALKQGDIVSIASNQKTAKVVSAKLEAPDIPASYGATVNEDGDYSFQNAYGYTFKINDVNGKIDGEDATLITTSTAYSSCNPNWAVSVQLRPTGKTNEYQVIKVVVCPGSASAANISFSSGDVIMVVHSSASQPGAYANWMSKVAAVALKKGDLVNIASDNKSVSVISAGEYIDPDADGDGIPDSYGASLNSKGDYVFENAYGYVFTIGDVNGKIEGEDATLITTASYYNSANPNWAVSVQLRPTGKTNEYQVVKVVVCPGSVSAAGISLNAGDKIMVVHSSASKPGTYTNWMSKVAAVALKQGDIVNIASDNKTVSVISAGVLPETPNPDADGDGILDCYGATVDSKGNYTFSNAYGYVFNIDDVNGKIEGEDSTLTTTSAAYSSCNPNWSVSVQLRPTGNSSTEYQVVKVAVCPGSVSAAGITLASGDKIMVVHSSASRPGSYANWMDKVAAIALKKGDYVEIASDSKSVTVIASGVLDETVVPVTPSIPSYGGAIPGAGMQGYTSNLHYGCDVSFYNVNDQSYANYTTSDDSGANYALLNFTKMKADGCDFVILRMGSSDSYGYYTDPHFFTLYKMARAAGLDVGLYFYSYAMTKAEAIAEAKYVISVLDANNMYFDYPIYIDIEESDQLALGMTSLSNICYGWCDTMADAGYFPGIYGNYKLYDAISAQVKSDYDFWLAYVSSATSASAYNPSNTNVSNECAMWQYSFYGYEYDGVGLDMLDVNVSYKDYPAIMAAYGYNNVR